MKAITKLCFFILVALAFVQNVSASETDASVPQATSTQFQDPEAVVKSLQDGLSKAKERVAALETELTQAQSTIRQLESRKVKQIADTQAGTAASQTVREEQLLAANGPLAAAEQKNVIADKYPKQVQRRPVAVTTLVADDIERGGITRITRVADLVPNMQYGQTGNEARIAMRGTRTNRTGAEAEQVVAIFEDGVAVPTTTQALGPYVDINRIEVLRGPQGVMYGRNAFGGVINIISNEPDLRGWDSSLKGKIGYGDGTRFEGMLNVPIRDTMALRIAARSDVHSGYVNNHVLEGDGDDLRDRKQQFVRLMTKWQPTDNFSMLLNIASLDQNQTGSGIWGYQQIGAYVDGQYLTGHQFAPEGAHPDGGPWNVSRNLASLEDQENLSGTLKLNWNFGFATLDWYANKSKFENQQVFDADYSNGGDPFNSDFNGWNSFRDTFSSEMRLTSNSTGGLDWLAGLSALSMESNWGWLQTINGVYSQPSWDSTGLYTTDSTAAFASAGYDISDQWRVSGGARWYDDKKQLRNGVKDSWSGVLWNAAVEYAVNENTHSYLSASTGYRPGGINEATGVPASYDSESVTALELGLKSVLADGTVVLNLSAFYNDYTDMQAQSFTILPLPGSAGLFDYLSTAGDMESKGVEAELQWMPGSRWNISANLAWLDAQFTNYNVPAIAGLGDIEGHTMGDVLSLNGWRPALSPEWSLGLQASYMFDMGHWGTLTPVFQTAYSSEYYANDLNLPGALQDAQSKSDLRLFWDLPDNKIKLQFYIENIEEQTTLNNVMVYNPEERPEIATFLANWGDLRTYGIILSYRY